MKKTKIFAAYLPQFHETKDNNEFWGKGFTDWEGVKNSKPQYKGHKQPKIPLNENYYDLSNWETIKWQANTARKYGIDGFNIYHYWFKNGKQELEKPAELLLKHKEIDIDYFFSWDNCSWVRSWSGVAGNDWAPNADQQILHTEKKILVERDYGDKGEWEKHFYYLLPFFQDPRYLKIEGKPVFAFMTNIEKEKLEEMGSYWQKLAADNGLKGIFLISRKDEFRNQHLFEKQFIYEPPASSWGKRMSLEGRIKKYLHLELPSNGPVKYFYDYDKVWKKIIKQAGKRFRQNLIIGCFVNFDDTPRRGQSARIIHSGSPKKFGRYFRTLYKMCCENNQELLLITAWNEWGEGAYLEPDEDNGYAYLEELKKAVASVNQ